MVKKWKTVYRTVHNGKPAILKQYDKTHSRKSLRQERDKAIILNKTLKGNHAFPKILKINYEELSITYEYIEGQTLQQLYDSNIPDNQLAETFYQIGKATRKIRLALINHTNNYYGDLSLNNIIINNKIWFIDVEPSRNKRIKLKESKYRDLVNLTLSFQRKPLFQKTKRNDKLLEFHLLKGYYHEDQTFCYVNYIKDKIKKYEWFKKSKRNIIRTIIDNNQLKKLKKLIHKTHDYTNSYKNKQKANNYDTEYKSENFHNLVWLRSERIHLMRTIFTLKKRNYLLDFATGTGRVLKETEQYFKHSYGTDTSQHMLDLSKTKHSKLLCQDVNKTPLQNSFDCVTAFRFFLNAEPSLRAETMFKLSTLLNQEGTLIFNIHGSTNSIYGLYCLFTKNRNLSKKEVKTLLDCGGLTIKKVTGHGYYPLPLKKIVGLFLYDVIELLTERLLKGKLGISKIYTARY